MLNYYLNYEKMYIHTKFAVILAAETFIGQIFFIKNVLASVRKKFKYIYSHLLHLLLSK